MFRTIKFVAATGSIQLLDEDERERIEWFQSVINVRPTRLPPLSGRPGLYPSFSSVAMKRIWILNDLFVLPTARRTGVGRRLLEQAADFARATSALRLVLATATDNHQAKALYEKLGWHLDQDFDHYALSLGEL